MVNLVVCFKRQKLTRAIQYVVFLLSSFILGSAVNPGCKCVRFTNTFGKEWGVFTSPDYPHSYKNGIRCLLYSFTAPKDNLVHIQFDNIHLPQASNSPYGCYSGDYLKLFLHLEEVGVVGVNEKTPWNNLICGRSYNQSFYSSSRHLIIQFHSGLMQHKSLELGFKGRFRFLNTSQFQSSGRLVKESKCDYQFLSVNNTAAQGKFFSPFYPSTYPNNIKCAYNFFASSMANTTDAL